MRLLQCILVGRWWSQEVTVGPRCSPKLRILFQRVTSAIDSNDSIHPSVFNRSTLVYIILYIEIYLLDIDRSIVPGMFTRTMSEAKIGSFEKLVTYQLYVSCFYRSPTCCVIQRYQMACAQMMSQAPISRPHPFLISQDPRQASKNRLRWLSYLVILAGLIQSSNVDLSMLFTSLCARCLGSKSYEMVFRDSDAIRCIWLHAELA